MNKNITLTENKEENTNIINSIIEEYCIAKQISDNYYTFEELYNFRKLYNAVLFNEWARKGLYQVHKSFRHYDGERCFDSNDWFIVVAILPSGQISNHYKSSDWDLFDIPAKDKAMFEFDGHTPKDVMIRLEKLLKDNE